MIIFIALVLVAAVAAAVLVNTSGLLQERAQSTGSDATKDVSSNLELVSVVGYYDSGASGIDTMNVTFQLASGAKALDLGKAIIRYSDGANVREYTWDTGDAPATETDWTNAAASEFALYWIRNVDGDTLSTSNPTMEPGDLVKAHFATPSALDERTDVELTLTPENGASMTADFRTPSTFGGAVYVTLR